MTTAQHLKSLTAEERAELRAFVERHSLRVRRAEAMKLLTIRNKHVFEKFVDAHPELAHKLEGEGQCKYLTEVIWLHLPTAARCATRNGEGNESGARRQATGPRPASKQNSL